MGQPILQPFLTSFFVLSHPERDGLYVCRWIKALSGPGLTPGEAPRRLSAWPSKSRSVTSPPPLPSPLAGVRRPASMASPRERRLPPPAFRMENPFSVKVLQVFTGFGVGCGVGIGVGRPIYLGMIPGLQQVMSATRGATDAFSGVTRHVNSALRTSGLKNIEAGIGCGVGIGHGFGIGIALKPRVLHGIQSSVGEIMSKLTSKLKDTPELQPALNPMDRSLSSGQQTQNGMHMGLEAKTGESNLKHTTSYEMSRVQHPTQPEALTGSRTEKVIADFLQSPLFHNDTKMDLRDAPPNLQGMDNVLQLVLKHQRVIEELREENENLRQILVEELKVSPTKLQINRRNGVKAYYPCSDCFKCRRRSRKTR